MKKKSLLKITYQNKRINITRRYKKGKKKERHYLYVNKRKSRNTTC